MGRGRLLLHSSCHETLPSDLCSFPWGRIGLCMGSRPVLTMNLSGRKLLIPMQCPLTAFRRLGGVLLSLKILTVLATNRRIDNFPLETATPPQQTPRRPNHPIGSSLTCGVPYSIPPAPIHEALVKSSSLGTFLLQEGFASQKPAEASSLHRDLELKWEFLHRGIL